MRGLGERTSGSREEKVCPAHTQARSSRGEGEGRVSARSVRAGAATPCAASPAPAPPGSPGASDIDHFCCRARLGTHARVPGHGRTFLVLPVFGGQKRVLLYSSRKLPWKLVEPPPLGGHFKNEGPPFAEVAHGPVLAKVGKVAYVALRRDRSRGRRAGGEGAPQRGATPATTIIISMFAPACCHLMLRRGAKRTRTCAVPRATASTASTFCRRTASWGRRCGSESLAALSSTSARASESPDAIARLEVPSTIARHTDTPGIATRMKIS